MRVRQKCPTIRQRYTRNLLLVALPLIALFMLSSVYSVQVGNQKVAESNRRMVGYWAEQTEETLHRIELFLSNLSLNEQELSVLAMKGKADSATHAMLSLLDRFDTAALSFPVLSALFCYSAPNDLFAARFPDPYAMAYVERESMRRTVRAMLETKEGFDTKGWLPYYIGQRYYLLRFFMRDGAGVVAAVDIENLTPKSLDDQATVVYRALGDTQPMTGADFIQAEGIRLGQGDGPFYLSGNRGQYMVIEQPFEKAGFSMAFILSGSGFWDGLDGMQRMLLALSGLTVVLVFLMYRWVDHWLNAPISQLTGIMERIKRGDLDAQIETPFDTRELLQVRDTFNDMMSQINALKIDAYEREIERQHVELQYLHLQIRPHFFLNCLKGLFACAQQQKTQQMQEMILSISRHIRYWFQDTRTTVTLGEEVEYALNYIKIQQLSLVPPPTCEMQIDEALKDKRIPPFTIQTFVENAIKHEWRAGRPLHITVKAALLEDGGEAYADICVADNGDGFPDEMLAVLNAPRAEPFAKHHIGLNNIKQRLFLLYGNRAVAAFYNNPGSHAEIILPLNKEEGKS